MSLGDKTLAVYYHMPYILKEDGGLYANPVMGTFIESLVPYFAKVLVFGFECVGNWDSITYNISNKKTVFISLGPEGQFYDYFAKMRRFRRAIKNARKNTEINNLLLRVPSHRAHAVWKYAGKPNKTALLFIGNPFFTPASYSNTFGFMYVFRKLRSDLHDRRMKMICNKSSGVVIANSQALVDLWGAKLKTSVSLVHTSSISEKDIIATNIQEKFFAPPYKLLFVGRVCYDKGIRELFGALKALNKKNEGEFILDIVGSIGDLGGNDIDQLIQQYNISEYAKHHGTVTFGETLFKFYSNADAYIIPSYHEGMPKTIWEAISRGTPVISTPVGGVGDFFVDSQDILFIKLRNSQSIVEAVQKLKRDKKLQLKLINNGLNKVSNITRESQAEKITSLLKTQEKEI
jgi:glycosyltransferase involved in cell wall biosynthesis